MAIERFVARTAKFPVLTTPQPQRISVDGVPKGFKGSLTREQIQPYNRSSPYKD